MTDLLRFSQNFLKSRQLVARLVQQSTLQAGDSVLEIGPGKGIITEQLAQQVGPNGRVTAVELDPALAANLQHQLRAYPQVQIVVGNILQYDLAQLPPDYKLFSNIPFNITSEIVEKITTPPSSPTAVYLILQTDTFISQTRYGVGETFKSLLIKPWYGITAVHSFAPTDFAPQPAVPITLFACQRLDQPLIDVAQMAAYKDFLAFVAQDRAGEGAWRKLFSVRELQQLATTAVLRLGVGLKSQTATAVAAAFGLFQQKPARTAVVHGAMAQLRQQQQKMDQINQQAGHHRSKRRK